MTRGPVWAGFSEEQVWRDWRPVRLCLESEGAWLGTPEIGLVKGTGEGP